MFDLAIPLTTAGADNSSVQNQKRIVSHQLAAKHHEAAAQFHRDAARYYDEGYYERAYEFALKANAHNSIAAECQHEVNKAHATDDNTFGV